MKNMKNILTIAALILIGTTVYGQAPAENKETKEVKIVKKTTESTSPASHQENEIRNFRFGLVVLPSINWYSTESKIIQRNGVAPKFGGGLAVEFRLAKVAAIATGMNIVTSGGKLEYVNQGLYDKSANSIYYYFNNNEDIVELDKVKDAPTNTLVQYQLNKRSYQTSYISIPLLLKLKTREIGSMVYYGQFGLNSYFRWKGRAKDDVSVIYNPNSSTPSYGATESKSQLMISKDVSFYNSALNFGLGTEWNLAGTTSMVLGISYNLGFTNVLRKDSKFLERRLNKPDYDPQNPQTSGNYEVKALEQIIKENSLVFTIGVLF